MQPGPPRQTEQQRFRLISTSMGGRNGVYPFGVQGRKAGIAQFPRPVLPCAGRDRAAHRLRMKYFQFNVKFFARFLHKSFVPVGRFAP